LPLNILRLTLSSTFYNKNAANLADLYLSKSFDQVHSTWLEFLSPVLNGVNALILYLGEGRGSKYVAEQGKASVYCLSQYSLAGNVDNSSVVDLFEALLLQRGRLKELQLLREW
jgi:hypothetical protein